MSGLKGNEMRRTITTRASVRGFSLFALLLLAQSALAAFTITSTSSPVFFTHASAGPKCSYRSFDVTSTTAVSDAWARIENFTTYMSIGGGDDGKFHFGAFTAGQTKPAFFYVCSSLTGGTTAASQGFDIRIYDRDPSLASPVQLATANSSFTINDNVIEAAANKVTVIFSGPNPATLGGTMTMTVEGDTGTMGCKGTVADACSGSSAGGPMAFTPAAFTSWRADAFELIGSNITFSSSANAGSYNNTLYIASLATSADTHYVITYYFRAVTTTAVTTTLSPVGFISSGTQIKHTNISGGAYSTSGGNTGLLPIEPASNTLVLGRKLVSDATLPAQGGRVTYTLEFTNSGSASVTVDSIYDELPSGASYVSGSASWNGTNIADPVVSGSTRVWSGTFTIPANSVRNLIFQADLPTPGTYTNSATGRVGTTVIDTTLTVGDNAPATATTVVLQAPVVTKTFSPSGRVVNGSSQLTLTLSNPNSAYALSGVGVSDTYPAGLVNASPSGIATTCAGATPTTTSNGTNIGAYISNVTLAAGASCTVTINVTSSVEATYTNTTGVISSSNGGSGGTASASVTFTTLPTVSKAFGAATIPQNGSTTLTLSVTNNGLVGITGVGLTDLFPAGLVLASPTGLSPASPCGGTLDAWNGSSASALAAGAGGLRLSGGAIATPGGSCSFSVNVTSATAGSYANTASGASSSLGSTGPASNTATLLVLAPPTVAKSFSPTTIGKNQSSLLTLTLGNPNSVAITGAGFTDIYPLNLVNAATPGVVNTCGGSVTAVGGGGSLALAGATIPAGGGCSITATVTSAVIGSYLNTVAAGAVTTANTPANSSAASATLVVNATPTITKSFVIDPAAVTTQLLLTITNNHTAGISGLSFSDSFPAGMLVDTTPTLTNTCGGTVTGATTGSTALSLAGGSIATGGGSCAISVLVRVNAGGVFSNTASGVSLTAPFTGTGSASNTATLIAPIIIKSFSPNQVGPNDVTRMTVQITNPSPTTSLTGLAFVDNYPAGVNSTGVFMQNAVTPSVTSSCGGTVTATAGASSLTFSGGSLAAGAACSVSVNVRANPTGDDTYYNVTNKVRANEGIGTAGADSLYIVTRPTITKSFLVNPVTLSGSAQTELWITIENNYSGAVSGLSVTDTFPSLPAQMKYVNTVSNGCGGALTDPSGAALVANTSTGIKLSGGSLAASATCTIKVTISVPADGAYDNTTTGATATSPAAFATPGPVSNTATLVSNLSALTVAKSFSAAQVAVNGTVTLTITLTNPNTGTVRGINLTDTYPGTMVNAAAPTVTNTCGGSATASAGSNTLVLSAGQIAASSSCTVTVQVTASAPGALTNNTGAVTATNAVTASAATANVTFYSAPTLAKAFSASSYGIGQPGTMTLTLTNPAANPGTLSSLQVSDDLSLSGLAVAATGVTFTPAGCGTVTRSGGGALVAADTAIRFNVTSLAAGASCQAGIAVVNSQLGAQTNTTGTPGAQTPGGVPVTGSVASASFAVVQANLTKSWGSVSFSNGGNTTLVFTLSNGSGNPAQGDIAFSDSLPSSLRFITTPGVTWGSGCSGSSAVTTGTPDSIAFSNVAMAASTASCTVTVSSVTNRTNAVNSSCASSPAAFTNGSGNLTGLTHLDNGVTSQCLVITGQASLSLLKSVAAYSDPVNLLVNPKQIPGSVSLYTIRLTNSGPGVVDANTVVVTDPLPAQVDLYVGDLGAAGSGPVAFVDGAPASGLGWSFVALGNAGDSVDFSQDGANWTYTPAPDASGFDASVRYLRLKPTGAMAAATTSNPYVDFRFRVRLR